MSNTNITATLVAREALRHLMNNLVFVNTINRQYQKEWESRNGGAGVEMGDTITIEKPSKYTVATSAGLSLQNRVAESVSLQVNSRFQISVPYTSAEQTTDLDAYSEKELAPKMATMAAVIDNTIGAALYKDVPNAVGTPGTAPSSFATSVQLVGRRLDDLSCPQGMRSLALNPAAHWATMGTNTGLYVQDVARKSLVNGIITPLGGFGVYPSQSIPSHTVGLWNTGSTGVTTGAGQTGSSITTDGWDTSTAILKNGDVFTIADVYAVNPLTKQSTGVLRQFVATADVTTNTTGQATISISPSIITTGAQQNCNAAAGDGKAITPLGTESTAYPQNMGYHRDFAGVAFVPLILPRGLPDRAKGRATAQGISVRNIWVYDKDNDQEVNRLDVMCGYTVFEGDWACRLFG